MKCETLEAVFIYGYTRKTFSLGFCWTWPPPAWWRLSDVFPRDEEIPEKARGIDKEVEGRKFASCIYWKRETDKQETRTSVTTEESASQSQKTNRGLFTLAQMTTQISPQHSVRHSVCYWFVSVSVRLCDSPKIISVWTSGKAWRDNCYGCSPVCLRQQRSLHYTQNGLTSIIKCKYFAVKLCPATLWECWKTWHVSPPFELFLIPEQILGL